MEKDQKIIGLSPDLIIHPGETLSEILEDRGMSQKELAIRTGVTEKHVSTVVKRQKNISVAFAKKLEYALGIDASFWINLQANYDRELLEFEEVNNITDSELSILKTMKEIIEYMGSLKWLDVLIKQTDQGKMILCMTIRKSRADIFWFTLFHEIGHILNGDIRQRFVDFDSVQSDMEAKADAFARDTLMDAKDYKRFVINKDFSLNAIDAFAGKQRVESYIVIGRLQSDGILGWEQYNDRMVYYKWAK